VLSTSLGMVVLGVKRAMKGIVITLLICRYIWSFYNSSHLLQVEILIFTHLLLNKLVIKHGWLLFKDGNFSQSCCNYICNHTHLRPCGTIFQLHHLLSLLCNFEPTTFSCEWIKVLICQIRKNFYFTHVKLFYIFHFIYMASCKHPLACPPILTNLEIASSVWRWMIIALKLIFIKLQCLL
jgi:hypothetical protein